MTSNTGNPVTSSARFQIVHFHARGGLGEVYLADDGELRRRVALKQMQEQHAHDPASRARFVAEAEITGGLEHPGIVPVYGLGQYSDGRPYYAMRFIQGENLDTAIRRFHRPNARVEPLPGDGNGANAPRRAVAPAGPQFNDQSTVSLPPLGATDTAGNAPSGPAVEVGKPSMPDPRSGPGDRARFASLAFRRLLGRFIDVCHAVDYAHSRGVVHRDLKPQNIMLGDFGETLVVDWGLAKVVGRGETACGSSEKRSLSSSAAGSEPTSMGQVVGTPRYMSPEQAAGRIDKLGPASDVYSLGATLYTLLTGQLPMAGTDRDEVLAAVQAGHFAPPRRVNRRVPAALEAICMRAMALVPAQRYASAAELAREVERWLADESVGAYREPWFGRCLRWSRRHRTWVASAGMLLLTLTAALGVGLVLLSEKQRQILTEHAATVEAEANATHSATRAQAINDFLLNDLLGQADPGQNARDKKVTVEELLDKAADRLERERHALTDEPEVEATLRAVIGGTYVALDATSKAERQLTRAGEIAQRELGPDHAVTLAAQAATADLLHRQGKLPEAEALQRHVWETHRRVLGAKHHETLYALVELAMLVNERGRLEEARSLMRESVDDLEQVLGPEHARTMWAMNALTEVLHSQGELAEAVELARQMLETQMRVLGRQHPDTLATLDALGKLLREQRNFQEAEPMAREAVAMSRQVLGPEHYNTIVAENNLSVLLLEQGNVAEAGPLMREVLAKRRRLLGDDHPSTLSSMNNLAVFLRGQGNLAEAETLLRELLATGRRTLGPEHPHTLVALNTLAVVLRAQNKLDEAEPLLRDLLRLRRQVLPAGHPELAAALVSLGGCLLDLGQATEAEPLCDEALSIYGSVLPDGHPLIATAQSALGEALLAIGRPEEAEPLLREAIAIRGQTLPPDDWRTADSQSLLGGCLAAQGNYTDAEPLLLAAYETLKSAKAAPAQRTTKALQRLIALYDAWGDGERAGQWRARLPSRAPETPSPAPETEP